MIKMMVSALVNTLLGNVYFCFAQKDSCMVN